MVIVPSSRRVNKSFLWSLIWVFGEKEALLKSLFSGVWETNNDVYIKYNISVYTDMNI